MERATKACWRAEEAENEEEGTAEPAAAAVAAIGVPPWQLREYESRGRTAGEASTAMVVDRCMEAASAWDPAAAANARAVTMLCAPSMLGAWL